MAILFIESVDNTNLEQLTNLCLIAKNLGFIADITTDEEMEKQENEILEEMLKFIPDKEFISKRVSACFPRECIILIKKPLPKIGRGFFVYALKIN